MILLTLVLLAYSLLYAFALDPLPTHWNVLRSRLGLAKQIIIAQESSLETWLEQEEAIAVDKLFANVAPHGRYAQDALPGTVIASPSREHPNYYYQWVRDAAITMFSVVDMYSHNASPNLTSLINAYANTQHTIQHTDNPSGSFNNLSGLGEPKFHVNGSAFTDNWGRPQRDGPALRALTTIAYLRAYNLTYPEAWQEDQEQFKFFYDPSLPPKSLIKADLEYVSHNWNADGFDLWEEVDGIHFFTAMVQYRALEEGADVAERFGDIGAATWYRKQAGVLFHRFQEFWSDTKEHLVAILDTDRTGLDCSLLLGSLQANPLNASSDPVFPPHSDEVLLSLSAFTRDQETRHPINGGISPKTFAGTGLGRYPEDVYDGYGMTPDGGNPWFLCTSSAAEILYRTASHHLLHNNIHVSPLALHFWTSLLPSEKASVVLQPNATYNSSTEVFTVLVRRLKDVGDEFLQVVRAHANDDGSLSEQFDRFTGYERGANDLTWSYGAFLQAYWARKRLVEMLE